MTWSFRDAKGWHYPEACIYTWVEGEPAPLEVWSANQAANWQERAKMACDYCDSEQDRTRVNCSQCGAPLVKRGRGR